MALVASQPPHMSGWRDSMISSSPISSTTGQLMSAETFSPPHGVSKAEYVVTKSEYGDIKSLAHSSVNVGWAAAGFGVGATGFSKTKTF